MSKGMKLLSVFLLVVAILVVLFVTGVIGKKEVAAPTGETTPTTTTGEAPTGEENGQLSDKEVQRYVKAVNKLFLGLPAEEKPLVAKIVDVEALKKEQQFYKDAQNDDVLVIYPSVAKAIIYRSSTNQIVNAGPLIVNQDEKAAASASNQQSSTQATTTTESKQ